jgi:hypothetical protein
MARAVQTAASSETWRHEMILFKRMALAAGLAGVTGIVCCSVGPMEGDWFQCKDEACAVLDDEGIRFTAGDRWGALDAPGGTYDPGEPYELEHPRGTYTYDGDTLTLTQDGSGELLSAQISFEGEVMVIRAHLEQQVCEPSPYRPGEPTPHPTCYLRREEKLVRFKRVGDAGEVPLDTAQPLPEATPPAFPGD